MSMENWKEESGIPHEDGKIKWYAIGLEEGESYYIGEYDMTDFDKTFDEEVFPKAQKRAEDFFEGDTWQVIRHDQVIDLMFNVSTALYESGDFKKWWLPQDYWNDWDEYIKTKQNGEMKDGV